MENRGSGIKTERHGFYFSAQNAFIMNKDEASFYINNATIN